jgi:basic membrane protein A and related proteins
MAPIPPSKWRSSPRVRYPISPGMAAPIRDCCEFAIASMPRSVTSRPRPRPSSRKTSDNTVPPNVAGIQFAFADASYLAGIIAGSVTKSKVIGTIGGVEIPPVRESFDAFAAGVHSVLPSARVLRAYVGKWEDVSGAKEQAIAQINQGADVIFQNADAAGLGVFQAARESKRAMVIGSNSNQNSVAPEITLGSVVIDLPHAFLIIARSVVDGSFRAQPISLGTKSEVVKYVANPATAGNVAEQVRKRVDSLQAEMFAGRFSAPRPTAAAH